jgi:hypothetical protein
MFETLGVWMTWISKVQYELILHVSSFHHHSIETELSCGSVPRLHWTVIFVFVTSNTAEECATLLYDVMYLKN